MEKLFPELQQLPSKSVCVCLLLICVVSPMTMKNIFIFLFSTDMHNTKAWTLWLLRQLIKQSYNWEPLKSATVSLQWNKMKPRDRTADLSLSPSCRQRAVAGCASCRRGPTTLGVWLPERLCRIGSGQPDWLRWGHMTLFHGSMHFIWGGAVCSLTRTSGLLTALFTTVSLYRSLMCCIEINSARYGHCGTLLPF